MRLKSKWCVRVASVTGIVLALAVTALLAFPVFALWGEENREADGWAHLFLLPLLGMIFLTGSLIFWFFRWNRRSRSMEPVGYKRGGGSPWLPLVLLIVVNGGWATICCSQTIGLDTEMGRQFVWLVHFSMMVFSTVLIVAVIALFSLIRWARGQYRR